jgi:hypothetical protein
MNSRYESEKDRFGLHSDDGRDAERSRQTSSARPADDEPTGASAHDASAGETPERDRLGPISEETKARYAELLVALEQTITQAVQQPNIPQHLEEPAGPDPYERDAATLHSEMLRPNRLPPATSPFAPPSFRRLPSERPFAEPKPLEPMPQSLFAERAPAFDYDQGRRREEAIIGLRMQTRPQPPVVRQAQAETSRRHGGRGFLRRIEFAGIAAGAVILLGALYLSDTRQAPNAGAASATPSLLQRAFGGAGDRQPTTRAGTRMVVTDLSGPKNRPIALGITVEAPPHGASVVIKGMPSGSRVTGGAADNNGEWRISARDLARATVIPPSDYVGTMNLAVDLRLADDTVADSDVLRLEWTQAVAEGVIAKPVKTMVIASSGNPFPAPPAPSAPAAPSAPSVAPAATSSPAVTTDASGNVAMAALASARPNTPPAVQQTARAAPAPAPSVRQLDRDEIATLVERGQAYLENGDISAARLLLRRAADAGHAQAAMALAATYDPTALKELGALGVAPDIATARHWYEKASQLGSAEAVRRLNRLAQQSQ